MVPPATFEHLATKWHHLHLFQSWPSDVTNLAIRLRHMHYHIALDYPIGIISYQLVSLSARVTSVKSAQRCVSQLERLEPIDRTRDTWVR